MERGKIIDKVKKLLEHSAENGATQAEAVAFALKAQKLIAENGIEDWELGDVQSREVIELESGTAMRRAWRKILLTVVADNFRCKAILHVRPRGRGMEQIPTMVGYLEDAEAAMVVYEHLLEVGDRLGRQHEDDFYTDPDAYESFVRGFTCGVQSELEKQCQALMLTCPQDVEDYLDGMSLRKAKGPRRIGFSMASIEAGISAGRDAVRSRRIGTGAAMLTA